MASVFDLGIAATARRSFAATHDFLQSLGDAAGGGDRARAARVARRLRAHPLTRALEAKWNLPVYFELVRGRLVADLDRAAAAAAAADDAATTAEGFVVVDPPPGGAPAGAAAAAGRSPFFDAAAAAIAACHAPDVLLRPVADRFVGLAFELLD